MSRSKDDGGPGQAAFGFDASKSTKVRIEREASQFASPTHNHARPQVAPTPVVVLADRRRARHHEVVRRLLAETGVFRGD